MKGYETRLTDSYTDKDSPAENFRYWDIWRWVDGKGYENTGFGMKRQGIDLYEVFEHETGKETYLTDNFMSSRRLAYIVARYGWESLTVRRLVLHEDC